MAKLKDHLLGLQEECGWGIQQALEAAHQLGYTELASVLLAAQDALEQSMQYGNLTIDQIAQVVAEEDA